MRRFLKQVDGGCVVAMVCGKFEAVELRAHHDIYFLINVLFDIARRRPTPRVLPQSVDGR